jgi:hypothetical protein
MEQVDESSYKKSFNQIYDFLHPCPRDGARGLQRLHDINPVTNTNAYANSHADSHANAD